MLFILLLLFLALYDSVDVANATTVLPIYETPTIVESEFGHVISVWPTIAGRNVKIGVKGQHVKLSISVDALSYVCFYFVWFLFVGFIVFYFLMR
jgi:hypothetical protein